MPESPKGLSQCWNRGGLQKGDKMLWNTLLAPIWLTVWKKEIRDTWKAKEILFVPHSIDG